MADILQGKYCSVFSSPKNGILIDDTVIVAPKLSDIDFNENDFLDAIKSMSSNAASGPIIRLNCPYPSRLFGRNVSKIFVEIRIPKS